MGYKIKEIFLSLQGEGANAGKTAVFCRFSDCNLWSGKPEDRSNAVCKFCDTDFLGVDSSDGGVFDNPRKVIELAFNLWPSGGNRKPIPLIIFTGGEPLLQLDSKMISAFKQVGFFIAVETNGTLPVPRGIDWVTVSPKAGSQLVVYQGDELKLIFPQAGAAPENYGHLEFQHFFLQPMDGPERDANIRLASMYCLEHPQWRLSQQMHKFWNIR